MKRWRLILVLILALALSFVAGLVTAIRVERAAQETQHGVPCGGVDPQIPWNGCRDCEARWGEFLCWLSGC